MASEKEKSKCLVLYDGSDDESPSNSRSASPTAGGSKNSGRRLLAKNTLRNEEPSSSVSCSSAPVAGSSRASLEDEWDSFEKMIGGSALRPDDESAVSSTQDQQTSNKQTINIESSVITSSASNQSESSDCREEGDDDEYEIEVNAYGSVIGRVRKQKSVVNEDQSKEEEQEYDGEYEVEVNAYGTVIGRKRKAVEPKEQEEKEGEVNQTNVCSEKDPVPHSTAPEIVCIDDDDKGDDKKNLKRHSSSSSGSSSDEDKSPRTSRHSADKKKKRRTSDSMSSSGSSSHSPHLKADSSDGSSEDEARRSEGRSSGARPSDSKKPRDSASPIDLERKNSREKRRSYSRSDLSDSSEDERQHKPSTKLPSTSSTAAQKTNDNKVKDISGKKKLRHSSSSDNSDNDCDVMLHNSKQISSDKPASKNSVAASSGGGDGKGKAETSEDKIRNKLLALAEGAESAKSSRSKDHKSSRDESHKSSKHSSDHHRSRGNDKSRHRSRSPGDRRHRDDMKSSSSRRSDKHSSRRKHESPESPSSRRKRGGRSESRERRHHKSSRHHDSPSHRRHRHSDDRRDKHSDDRRDRHRDSRYRRSRSRDRPRNFKEHLKAQLLQSTAAAGSSGTTSTSASATLSASIQAASAMAASKMLSDGSAAALSKFDPSALMHPNEKKSVLPLNSANPLSAAVGVPGEKVTPQQALAQTMAAMHQKAQEITGVAVPTYYNPAAVNPLKYAEQIKKRKLLWSKAGKEKDGEKDKEENKVQWTTSSYSIDEDGKGSAKFRKLMGIKEEDKMLLSDNVDIDKLTLEQRARQDELFNQLDRDYAFARMSTHTHRGVGLGFSSQGMPDT